LPGNEKGRMGETGASRADACYPVTVSSDVQELLLAKTESLPHGNKRFFPLPSCLLFRPES
jgi:hypothetical protein